MTNSLFFVDMKWWGLVCIFMYQSAQAQLLPSYGDSRTGTSGWQFLKVAPDARSVGFGESYLAIADDVASLYWNPAGLTHLDSSTWHTMVAHTNYPAGINQYFVGVVRRLNSSTLLGSSLQYFDAGNQPVTTEFLPEGNGLTYRPINMAIGVSWAQVLTDAFSFGLSLKYVRENIATVHNQNLLFDLGFRYDIGIARTRFAVGLSNFGFNTSPSGEVIVWSILDTQRVETVFEEVGVPTVFRLGFAWDAVQTNQHRLTTSAQLNHPTDNNETYALGLEYAWKEMFLVRSGYQFSNDLTAWPAVGFGIQLPRHFGMVKLDYGFSVMNRLGAVNRLSIQVSL